MKHITFLHNVKLWSVLVVCAAASVFTANAQTSPKVQKYNYSDQSYIVAMSDNGSYALAQPAYSDKDKAPKFLDLTTGAYVDLLVNGTETVSDITDDGSIIVGTSNGKPAYCTISAEGKVVWTNLKMMGGGWAQGRVTAITPDGKYAVGDCYSDEGYVSVPVLWDVKNNTTINTPNLPELDMAHADMNQMTFTDISADGKYILGCMSYSYLPADGDLGGCCYFVYDRSKESYTMIGFTESEINPWTPAVEGLVFVGDAKRMSPNGLYVTGNATMDETHGDGEFAFLYSVADGKFTLYNTVNDQQGTGYAVSNDGIVLLSTPNSSPIREWSVRSGDYWYSLSQIYQQQYGKDFYELTGLDNTGTANLISADGKRVVAFPDPYSSYVIDFEKPVSELCQGMTLLGSYSISPAEGSVMSKLGAVEVTFPYQVQVVGAATCVQLLDSKGNVVVNSIGMTATGAKITVTFRKSKAVLNDGETYTVRIPAGSIAYANDVSQQNAEIVVTYKGRKDEALVVTEFYPAANTYLTNIDSSTSPLLLTFSADVQLDEEKVAYLYRNAETTPIAYLYTAYKGNQVLLYPATTMNLQKGNTYTVGIPAALVTDAGGNNPNDTTTVTYNGAYERVVSADDITLFSDDFSGGTASFMLYCGDQLAPTEEMEGWDFVKGLPWSVVGDDADTTGNLAAASHSMYNNGGKSDDWLVTPQIYVPDQLCTLEFKSQSYLSAKSDRLKVVVWESDKVYNELYKDIVDQMKEEGVTVYNEVQTPGAKQDVLADDWKENVVDLKAFAGKNVYIAFVNDNENQSAVFLDDVKVLHNMNYLVSFTNETSVVAADDIIIKGQVTGNNPDKTYQTLTLALRDADGTVIDTYVAANINLKKNANVDFAFAQPLPLEVGSITKFSVVTDLDGEENVVSGTVKDMAFKPLRHVVIEEFTGQSCGNCPLGILAIEKAEKQYGGQVIPISIHTYGGDAWATGMSDYTTFLGLSAAPTGRINRGEVSSPAASEVKSGVNRYYFRAKESGSDIEKLWLDEIDELMATPAECSVTCTANYEATENAFTVPVEVRYALNTTDLNVNVFAVLLEDGLLGVQDNYFYSVETNDLGEWSQGGAYGKKTAYPIIHNDVARQCVGITYNGTAGLIPTTVKAGESYTTTLTVPVPSYVTNAANCKVAVMLIDANSGRVINATLSNEDTEGISTVKTDIVRDDATYNMQGQRVKGTLRSGIYVRGGKKILVK